MSVARRPLLTATAAGALLCALWFVPSANANDEGGGARTGIVQEDPGPDGFAESGPWGTVPYLLGGTAFLGVGAASVTLAMRRRGRAS
ncbi:hypothetical protein ACIRQY_04840 [Streptomyces sp. NPDC101490]|uniref:hypothetical protein n=1 Tax=unclassified Streptomyces TaxID=2593676 RepID=UPI00332F76CC